MGISKVVLDGNTIMDLGSVTATAEHILSRVTAHDKYGDAISGTAIADWSDDYIRNVITPLDENGAYYNDQITYIGRYGFNFSNNSNLKSVSFPNVTEVGVCGLYENKKLTSVNLPLCETIGAECFRYDESLTDLYIPRLKTIGASAFAGCAFTVLAFPSLTSVSNSALRDIKYVTTIDLGPNVASIGQLGFGACTVLTTVILRSSSIVRATYSTSNIFSSTPFASGGTGGTIYIPKVLYDHLGDGSAYDYQSATNWTAIHSYGTVTWAQIEGSQYEDYYADGTAIES